jgi:hypothetical protein
MQWLAVTVEMVSKERVVQVGPASPEILGVRGPALVSAVAVAVAVARAGVAAAQVLRGLEAAQGARRSARTAKEEASAPAAVGVGTETGLDPRRSTIWRRLQGATAVMAAPLALALGAAEVVVRVATVQSLPALAPTVTAVQFLAARVA